MRRKGFTLVEVMTASALTTVVVGAVVLLYGFVAARTSAATARLALVSQASTLASEMQATIRDACSVEVVTQGSVSALKCVMPAAGEDTDADGQYDRYLPSKMSATGQERFTKGNRVWFFFGPEDGTFGKTGTVLCRAVTNDDAYPTAANLDQKWTFGYSKTPRFSLITGMSMSVDPVKKLVSLSFSGSSTIGDDDEGKGANEEESFEPGSDVRQKYDIVLSRTIFWRNWKA